MFTIYKHFGDFVKCILRFCCKFSIRIPTSRHRQAKVRRFLGICLYDYFIYRTNFVFRKSRNETPSWLRSQNSEKLKIFRVTGANQSAQKLLFTDLVNTNMGYATRCWHSVSNTLAQFSGFKGLKQTQYLVVGNLGPKETWQWQI